MLDQDAELPLLRSNSKCGPIAWRNGKAIERERFLHDICSVASRVPEATFAINLCEDRYWFMVSFCAALVAGQTNLLPPSRSVGSISKIIDRYRDCYYFGEQEDERLDVPGFVMGTSHYGGHGISTSSPTIARDHLAALVFTSGSTGTSQPAVKRWHELVSGCRNSQRRLGFGLTASQQTIVATVPSQHMYGLEFAVLNTLMNDVSTYVGPTFFPADIRDALASVPIPRILITTPLHLNAACRASLQWPTIALIVSATAPLTKELAVLAEQCFGCPVMEIYGSSEAGSVASRHTNKEVPWLLHDQFDLVEAPDGYAVRGPNLPEPVLLHDIIEPVNKREFLLHGRRSDMIKIGGKRASLEDLNNQLQGIQGITDGAFVDPGSEDDSVTRLIALVVTPTLEPDDIRRALLNLIDPVFLPRHIYKVNALPRNETGKLPKAALMELVQKARQHR